MSLGALFGTLFGFGLFILAVLMSTDQTAVFLQGSGLLMVLGGTIATAFMSYEARYVRQAFNAIGWMLKKPKSTREGLNTEIMRLIKWSYLVQKRGVPALEDEIKKVQPNDPITKYCLTLVSTNHTPVELRGMMDTAVEAEFERKTVAVDVLRNMGAAAPAFGMIGTLVGLVAVLQGLAAEGDVIKNIGSGMALALMTTLYGVVLARMVFFPAATKMIQKEEVERFRNFMVCEGLIMLSEKKSPRYMQDRLNSFLDPDIHFNIDTQVRR